MPAAPPGLPVPPDTIVAVATPPGRGGIGIVRVSGPLSAAIARAVVGALPDAREAVYATFRDAAGAPLDTGIALHFPAPRSYTGDDVLELQGHGSPAALRLVVARCLELGARLAGPGEFTRRAFLNGRIDLAQAEGVADLIEASGATAARAAARSLTGVFSREVAALVDEVTELRMLTEASLDFPEEDITFVLAADAQARLAALRARVDGITARARSGARLREGLTLVLVGRPNVGKSSLMNRLAQDDVAIVTDVPGTTRDTVERPVTVRGMPVTLVDTAGLRATDDAVEKMGIARTWSAVERADGALVIVDAREGGVGPGDAAILAQLPAALPRMVVHNKADLCDVRAHRKIQDGVPHLWLSALTGEGCGALETALWELAGVDRAGEDSFLARERHLVALEAAAGHLANAAAQLQGPVPPLELFAEELRVAQRSLSSIAGEFTADDLLGVIFSRFCIGK